MPRRYRLKRRAERQQANRRRIVEAAFHLHSTVGAAGTTTSAIARLAGVERPTVLRHFRDRLSLYRACTLHGMQLDPPPDPAAWTAIHDPAERLETALREHYAWYRRNRSMLRNRREIVDEPDLAPLLEAVRQPMVRACRVLATDWPPAAGERLLAAISHALNFEAWESLTSEQGLSDDEAAALMVDMVRGVAQAPASRGPSTPK